MVKSGTVSALPANLALRCTCGHVHATATGISPARGLRLTCYCKDCQAFSRFLERPDILDPAGGTDIFQMPVTSLKFTAGQEALRCVHLSSSVFRWYTDCCRTPIGNGAGPRFPLLGLIHTFISPEMDSVGRNEVLGKPLCRLYDQHALGPLPPDAPPPPSARLLLLRMSRLASWWWLGLGHPNPFFDDKTMAPLSIPHVLTATERTELYRKVS